MPEAPVEQIAKASPPVESKDYPQPIPHEIPEGPVKKAAPVQEQTRPQEPYPTIIEEPPHGITPSPESGTETPERKRSQQPEFDEPSGENIAFL
jgi:hypothetical protein